MTVTREEMDRLKARVERLEAAEERSRRGLPPLLPETPRRSRCGFPLRRLSRESPAFCVLDRGHERECSA